MNETDAQEDIATVLIVDDDDALCELMTLRLTANGYHAHAVHSAEEALPALRRERPDIVILDLRLGTRDGLDVLVELLADTPTLKVLVLTAHGSIETAVEAMRRGAHGFMTKPFRDRELLDSLAEALDSAATARDASVRRNAPQLLGNSAAICQVRSLIERLAPTDVTVLVTGESGTGKELVARSLHDLSTRHTGPFVPINCGALPPELLTSELFGHAKGAFTGATRDREGVFGAARGGTLFLDEIGEAPHDVQVRLLRVLQEQRYMPVGGNREKSTDVRIVAATNRDLHTEVQAKRFREDLYYRLHVVPLHLPPLRERGEDIPLLANIFLKRAADRHKRACPKLSDEALALLCADPLPGNVRQLGHVMEAALLLNTSARIDAALLRSLLTPQDPPGTSAPDPREAATKTAAEAPAIEGQDSHAGKLSSLFQDGPLPPFSEVKRELERAYLIEVLRRARGNVTAAARMAGRHRTDFYELLRKHDLSGTPFRQG